MEESVLEGHLEDRLCPHRGHAPPLGGREHKRTDVPELGPLDVLFCQHPRGREPKVDLGDNYLRPREVRGEAASILRLCRVIQLAPDNDLELGHEAAHVHKQPAPEPPVEQSGEVTHELEVTCDPTGRLGPLHLDGNGLPATQHGPVDLPDARRAERRRVERGEQLIDGSPELTLDYLLGKPWRHGRSRVLELLELGEYSFRQYVRACGEDLPELDEGRPQIVEGAPEPDAEVGREELLQALLLPPVPPDVEDEAETVTHEDAAYLREPPEVPGPGSPSVRQVLVSATVPAGSRECRRYRAGARVHRPAEEAPRDGPRASSPGAPAVRCGTKDPRSSPWSGRRPSSGPAAGKRRPANARQSSARGRGSSHR